MKSWKSWCVLSLSAILLSSPAPGGEEPELSDLERRRRELTEKHDADGDGRLDVAERESLRRDLPARRSRQGGRRGRRGGFRWPEEVVERFDSDGDGELDERESQVAADTLRGRARELQELYDTTGDGRLDEDEMRALGRDVRAGKIDDVPFWFRFPPEGSGRVEVIRWERFDEDGDGRLDREELAEARRVLADPPEGFRVETSPTRVVTSEWPRGEEPSGDERAEEPDAPEEPPRASRVELEGTPDTSLLDEPFTVELTASGEGARIVFTLDATEPGPENGTVYEAPLEITETTVLRARALEEGHRPGRVLTRTFIFPDDVPSQSSDGLPPEGAPYRWGRNIVDYGMDPDIVESPEYRDELPRALRSLPSISLVADPDDLFGRRGIYAYARMSGREAERPASVEFLPGPGGQYHQADCGVRIRGGFSRTSRNAKHGFRLFFRKQYGKGKLRLPLFGPGGARAFDNLDLRCSQNYSWNLGDDGRGLFVRDQFSRDLQLAMGHPAARGDFVHLYLNGQYWGLFNTCERVEASHGATYLGGKRGEFDVVKMEREYGVFATDGDLDAWRELHRLLESDLSRPENYRRLLGQDASGQPSPEYERLIEPENLIDYMLIIFWSGNLDAPVTAFARDRHANNWYGLRRRDGEEGFRFFIWDAEHTLLDPGVDRTGPFPAGERFESSNPQWVWQHCLENEEFRVLALDRIQRRFRGVLSVPALQRRFRHWTERIESAVVAESARWGDAANPDQPPRTREHWREEVRRIHDDFIPRRHAVVLHQLWEHGLVSDLEFPEVTRVSRPGEPGEILSLRAPSGSVWLTTDGSDPRMPGGDVSERARKFDGEFVVEPGTVVRARIRLEDDWGPLRELRIP